MMSRLVVSDFDGVIGDSLRVGLQITKQIAALLDEHAVVDSFQDYYRLLGRQSALKDVTESESDTLRELYRILHRHSAHAIRPFVEVLTIYARLSRKPLIVSSSYADTIRTVLGEYGAIFDGIYGYESGRKLAVLQQVVLNDRVIYVGDTVRDVQTCATLGIPVIAVTWGYDPPETLVAARPDYLVHSFDEFGSLLSTLE